MSIDLKQYRTEKPPSRQKKVSITKILNTEVSFGRKKLSDKFKSELYGELSLLLESGLDIQQALQLLSAEQKRGRPGQTLERITSEVIAGSSLSDVLDKNPDFDPYEVYTLRIGEETGNLAPVAKELALHFDRKQDLKRQLIGVFAYPFFVLFVSVGVVYFMLNYVVPLFADVFKRFGAELPLLTRIIIKLSDKVQVVAPWVFLSIILIFIFLRISRQKTWYRKSSSVVILKLPLFGNMAHQVYLSRFCQAMHVLTRADVQLTHALDLTRRMVRFYPMEDACSFLETHISNGGTIAGGMSKLKIFPNRIVSLVKVGEEVNQLDKIFGKLSVDLSRDVDQKSKTIGKLLEPALILVIGVLVAFILVGMYLPLFEMSKLMK